MTTQPITLSVTSEDDPKHRYSEIFSSIQGEGHYTGVPTMWVRWWACNLTCSGFGQPDPADPDTYELPYKDFDPSTVKSVEDLPVWTRGCDSSYSWSKKYRHLCPEKTAAQIADQITDLMRNKHNPLGSFRHPNGQDIHLCVTGGEPMLKKNQVATADLIREFVRRGNQPTHITVETNGTQPVREDFGTLLRTYYGALGREWFWSVSPKLLHTSGETAKRAIKPETVASYMKYSTKGQLKFVVCNSEKAWDELEEAVQKFRRVGVHWPVWIMPVGATEEDQRNDDMRAVVAETIARGYNVSARLQAYIWGNTVGV